MNPTVDIELSGLLFHLDEQAHAKFKAYLISLQNALGEMEGKDEIIVEVEARIAELFQQALESGRQVISLNDVVEACSQMGEASDFREDTDPSNEEQPSKKEDLKDPGMRRFYRDGENRIIGGVATGMGHYFRLDPVILRLVFVLSIALLGPFSVFIYLLLWSITPKARTVAEQLVMRGESANFENIKSRVQTEFDHVGKVVWESKFRNQLGAFIREVLQGVGKVTLFFFRLIGWIFLGVLTLFLLIAPIIFFSVLTGIESIEIGGNHLMPELHFLRDISQLILPSGPIADHLGTWAMLLLAFPFAVFTWLVLRLIFRTKMNTRHIGAGLGVGLLISLVGVIAISSIGGRIGMDSKEEFCQSETLHRFNDSHKTTIEAIEYDSEPNDVTTNLKHMWRLDQESTYAMNLVAMDLDVRPSLDSKTELIVEQCSFGLTRKKARQRAKNIACDVPWRADGTIEFPTHFTFPKTDLYRGQHVRLTLSIPIGDTLFVSSETAHSLANMAPFHDHSTTRMFDNEVWIMTKDGLEALEPF